jgi:hypothetical protein
VGQITTYGSGGVTEAQRRAAKERSKERTQIAEAERRESLRAAGQAALEEAAIDLALEAERNVVPPDPKIAAAAARKERAQRKKDEARLAELVAEWEENRDAEYQGLDMMFGAVFADMELSVEAAALARKLGANNPIERGTMMWVNDGLSGVPQNKMHLVERICDRIKGRYRSAGGHFNRADFERPV